MSPRLTARSRGLGEGEGRDRCRGREAPRGGREAAGREEGCGEDGSEARARGKRVAELRAPARVRLRGQQHAALHEHGPRIRLRHRFYQAG